MSLALWLVGLVAIGVAATIASSRARAMPGDVVGRATPLAAAIACAGLAGSAVWVWGGELATDGRADRLRDGAAVRITLRAITVAFDPAAPRAIRIGHADSDDVRLPGSAELARIEIAASGVVAKPGSAGIALIAGDDPAAFMRGCRPSGDGLALPAGGTVIAIACDAGEAVAIRRAPATSELALTPIGAHGDAPHAFVRAGDVLRIGDDRTALPGITNWSLAAARGTAAVIAVPRDPTDCAAWDRGRPAANRSCELVLVGRDPCPAGSAADARCDLETGFALTAQALVPDAAAVSARGVRVALAIACPVIALLAVLVLAAPSRRRARLLAGALRLAVLACVLAALACWRLAWAHRIDMLRELASRGALVAANSLAAAAIGATIAGLAAGLLSSRHRAAVALAGWAAWAFAAAGIVGVTPRATTVDLGVLAMSAFAAIAPWLRPRWGRTSQSAASANAADSWTSDLGPQTSAGNGRVDRAPQSLARFIVSGRGPRPQPPYSAAISSGEAQPAPRRQADRQDGANFQSACLEARGPYPGAGSVLVALLAIAAAASVARAVAPHLVIAKLGLAWLGVIAGHAALRAVLAPGSHSAARLGLPLALVATAIALARFDTGVTVAITGSGLAIAMLVAGLDAVYDAGAAVRLGVLEREHARVLAMYGGAGIVLALAAASWVLTSDDRALVESTTTWALYAPLAVAMLYATTAIVVHGNRRRVLPWLAAAAAALALFVARAPLVEHATEGHSVAAARVSAVVSPGYALLRDAREFAASASAWREAMLPDAHTTGTLHGQGYFAARLIDPGVVKSLDNDYVAVLIAREAGAWGVVQSLALIVVLVLVVASTASVRLRHASAEHRARWLVAAVAFVLCIYQPLAALGVLPLTGIGWPGLAIDSPADLWLFVLGAGWCLLGGDDERSEPATVSADERVRATPRLRRARALVLAALVVGGIAAVALVARASAAALARVAGDDARVATALRYAGSLACPWTERTGASANDVVPIALDATPGDDDTARFDRELRAMWSFDRPALIAGLPDCHASSGRWRLARDAAGVCHAELVAGWPTVSLAISHDAAWHATCAVTLPREVEAALRARPVASHARRIRVVGEALGTAARDVGELATGDAMIRLRPSAATVTLAAIAEGSQDVGAHVALAPGVVIDADPQGVTLHGAARLFVATATGWQRVTYEGVIVLERESLIVAGGRVVLFRPRSRWGAAALTSDPLLADDVDRAGERTRRAYPYGGTLPELGWVNPYDVDRSLGLDGWIHAALGRATPAPAACGTLAPPPIPRAQVCTTSSLDGVTECRVALQPELAASLRALADRIAADPAPVTGHPVPPTRIAYVVLRGDTGEVLAQANVVPGREPLAYAPGDADAEARLIALRQHHGESDAERIDWNLPIAVGSTFKPIVARAAELAFPSLIDQLTLTAAATPGGCRAHHGKAVDPILGHCPPSSLADDPTTADLHDFLARSLNWYQAALGLIGLALPDGSLVQDGQVHSLAEVGASDLATWPTRAPLVVRDAQGPILDPHRLWIDGLRRTPLWQRIEQLLGRPLCTLGDRASCHVASERADVCAARALPIAGAGRDLRELVALGPDRVDFYGDDRPHQAAVPVREYFQLLRGSGVHAIGSLAQLADAFGRVVYDDSPGPSRLAASWFPAPAVGTLPSWSCANAGGHAAKVRGADGGLCAVVQAGGTAGGVFAGVLADPHVVVYGAKTGTTDSLADLARDPILCETWNHAHVAASQLACGKAPPDDSLFVVAFGVVTDAGTIPITLAIQLQRGDKSSAARAAPSWIAAIASYLRGD